MSKQDLLFMCERHQLMHGGTCGIVNISRKICDGKSGEVKRRRNQVPTPRGDSMLGSADDPEDRQDQQA